MLTKIKNKIKIYFLLNKKIFGITKIKNNFPNVEINNQKSKYENKSKIFGEDINFERINWHKDYKSKFDFPAYRIDKLNISDWFDKGIDVKFPWELSRFYFAIKLAQNYRLSKKKKYYNKFKDLVKDWINNNPFCYGVNWYCTMEVAIRAINWVVAINIFGDIFKKDKTFNKKITKALFQHAEYISTFPEIYKNGHTTNHTTADYTGLLFLSLTLEEHPKSKKWLKQAKQGLEKCIRYQTYDDGVNFEASIPYHRLVLEMFAYSSIVTKASGIDFSKKYYELLFKMFEYSAAYIDHNGNAPQVGDNDSGRILIFHESNEHDHSYLLDLGKHIFDYEFKSQCKKFNTGLEQWLPKNEKINPKNLDINFRETDTSIAFEKGSAYFLKNKKYFIMASSFPLGQNGKGGHNHYDTGSIVLSVNGVQIIVDSGTYTYTSNRKVRDKFRDISSHNIIFTTNYNETMSETFWSIRKKFICEIEHFSNNKLILIISNLDNTIKYYRKITIYQNKLYIVDKLINGAGKSQFHLHPNLKFIKSNDYKILLSKKILIQSNLKLELNNSVYSPSYGEYTDNKVLEYYVSDKLDLRIEIL